MYSLAERDELGLVMYRARKMSRPRSRETSGLPGTARPACPCLGPGRAQQHEVQPGIVGGLSEEALVVAHDQRCLEVLDVLSATPTTIKIDVPPK